MKYCKHRGHFTLVKTTISNGRPQVRMLCGDCGDVFGSAVSQSAIDLDDLQAFEVAGLFNPPCTRCGSRYSEYHHYMPVAMARDAGVNPDEWATGYLCQDCHALWHKIVTPMLVPKNGIIRRIWEEPKP
jgi:hypothetical protein